MPCAPYGRRIAANRRGVGRGSLLGTVGRVTACRLARHESLTKGMYARSPTKAETLDALDEVQHLSKELEKRSRELNEVMP